MTLDLLRQDTICAPATASGSAAIAVLRVSGPRADAVRAAIFTPRHPPQRPAVATLGDAHVTARFDDEALCIWFPAGKSYTGEASFELQLHGNPHIVERALAQLRALGCRMAEPGELTLRAVLTGRLDLSAAEAVDDLIVARSEAGLLAAARNLRGGLRAVVEPVRARLIDALAEIEARLDFPDEDLGDIPAHVVAGLQAADVELQRLLASSHAGERLVRGARIVLYGPPNAGKSSLFNALLREERALVHDEPGTTRDVVEAPCTFGPFAATLVDVAGVRELALAAHVEQLGIARAQTERERADLVLAVMPAHWPQAADALAALGGDIAVFTHGDVIETAPQLPTGAVVVSTRSGAGLDVLRQRIEDGLRGSAAFDEEALVMRARQTEQVRAAQERVRLALHAARDRAPYEVVASEARGAALALDRLLGRDLLEGTNAEVLDAIFSRFCIGK